MVGKEANLILTMLPQHPNIGDTIFFQCDRNTSEPLLWAINGTLFPGSSVPPKHTYIGSGLVLSNVDRKFNSTVYECCTSEIKRSNKQIVLLESSAGEEAHSNSPGGSINFAVMCIFFIHIIIILYVSFL